MKYLKISIMKLGIIIDAGSKVDFTYSLDSPVA